LRGRSPEGVPDCGQERRRPRVRSTDQALGRRACSTGHHGATPGRHHDRSARSIAGRGRKGLRLIPRSQPIPEARPQPEIAARSAEPAPRILARVRAQALPAWACLSLASEMGPAPDRRSTPSGVSN
jgi:hypothetical protein